VTAKHTPAPGKPSVDTKVIAPFSRWFSSDGYFVAKPFQQMLAGCVPAIGEADPKNAVVETNRTEKPVAVPAGSQNFKVNIANLPDVLEHINRQADSSMKRRG
jgi:hypothetical protein